MGEIIIADTDTEYTVAKELFEEYAAWLGIDLCFQKFNEELLQLRQMYGLPSGAILLYKDENRFGGCVAIRHKGNEIAELKRMYIQPPYRGLGIGKSLLEKALALSKKLGYKKIRLDTLSSMTTAIQLYRTAGFYNIEAYYFNPEPEAVFFEKEL